MSAAKALEPEQNTAPSNNISVNARVDYILRFSKQAVIVLGNEKSDYGLVAHQFIANLSTEHNAAFITASASFNDIQIRCRLIEQLFPDTLFDPEQSLAVSLLNLIKQSPQKISIAFEHSQHLSLQLIHELVQLADIAKKMELLVNILLCGDYATGNKLADNTILFKNKVSILSSASGQIIPLTSKELKRKTNFIQFSWLKLCSLIGVTLLFIAGFVAWQYLMLPNTHVLSEELAIVPPATFVVQKQTAKSDKPEPINQEANSHDILQALNGTLKVKVKAKVIPVIKQPASPQDVLNALKQQQVLAVEASKRSKDATLQVNENIPQSTLPKGYIDDSDFVIQLAAFATQEVKQQFIQNNPSVAYLSYKRLVDERKLDVLTTTPFSSYQEAKAALSELPESLKIFTPWVKSVKQIKTEIKHYQSSQF